MTQPVELSAPRLAAPGAGLPFWEQYLARYVLLPLAFRRLSWESADALFQSQGRRLLAAVQTMSPARIQRRVLIPRIRGIEDSSRNWSPGMVLEHLIIVGTQMMNLVVTLSRGDTPAGRADVAAVKPKGVYGADAPAAFAEFLAEYAATLAEKVRDRDSRARFLHPWFGRLNTRQWHAIAAIHQRIHRQQMDRIVARYSQRDGGVSSDTGRVAIKA